MSTEEMQKMMMEALASGKVPVGTVVVGDQVEKKIIVEAGGIGEQTINNYYDKKEADAISPEENNQAATPVNKVDAAIKAVFDANVCKAPDWAAVTRLLSERNLKQQNGLNYDADYINKVCGQEVTNNTSLSRAFIHEHVGGRYPNWFIRPNADTRESDNKLRLFNSIGKIVADALDK